MGPIGAHFFCLSKSDGSNFKVFYLQVSLGEILSYIEVVKETL